MPSSTSAAGIRDRFTEDHRELEDLFSGVLDAFEANDRDGVAELWSEFEERLGKHMDAEERWMIPALFASRPREARALLEEHRHVRRRLTELGCCVDLHTIRLDDARSFIDELRAHAEHEDAVLYAWAEDHLEPANRRPLLDALTTPLRRRLRHTG